MSEFPDIAATPPGWTKTTLGEVRGKYSGSVNPEKAPDQTFEHYSVPSFDDGQPVLEPGNEIGSSKKQVEEEMVLLCKINPRINRVWTVENHSAHPKIASTEWIRFPHQEGVFSPYLCYYMRQHAFRNYLAGNVSGVGGSLMRAKKSVVDRYPLLLPSLPEQRRIVAKIEELFSDLDAGVADLKRAQQQLQRYRQSVLQAAVEGRLTKDWREEHGSAVEAFHETPLRERILEERQAQWEKDYRAKYEAKGKKPPSGWKSRYKPPEEPDVSDLPELPKGWVWTNIEHVAISGPQNGLYLPKSKYGSGTPILRIDDYQNGWSRSADELQKVQADVQDIEKYSLHEGDIVINRVNSMTHLGKCLTVVDRNLPSLFESNMMRLHLTGTGHRKYFEYFLRSASGRQALLEKAKQAVNQASINQGDVKGTFVPLPPAEEQRQIVNEVERLLSVAEEATQTVEREIKRAERLRQSILKQAFSGRLASCDAEERPARDGQMALDL